MHRLLRWRRTARSQAGLPLSGATAFLNNRLALPASLCQDDVAPESLSRNTYVSLAVSTLESDHYARN